MWTIFIALILGGLLGGSNKLPKSVYKYTDKLTLVGLIILLFSMGVSIGNNDEILKHLDSLGIQALAIATFSIIGSVLAIWFLQRNIFRGGEN